KAFEYRQFWVAPLYLESEVFKTLFPHRWDVVLYERDRQVHISRPVASIVYMTLNAWCCRFRLLYFIVSWPSIRLCRWNTLMNGLQQTVIHESRDCFLPQSIRDYPLLDLRMFIVCSWHEDIQIKVKLSTKTPQE